jgi:hypothetical protein
MNRASIGRGALAIGAVVFALAAFDLAEDKVQPQGTPPRSSLWMPGLVGELLGSSATLVMGAVWLAVGITFIVSGSRELFLAGVSAKEQRTDEE